MVQKTAAHRRKMSEKRLARDEAAEQSKANEEEDDEDYDDDYEEEEDKGPQKNKRKAQTFLGKVKWKHVALLALLTGTAVLPGVLWAADHLFALSGSALALSASAFASRAGLTPTPKDRLVKFYEKHNPDKVSDVPQLVHKYAGNYDKMVKTLEAKYGDYGFFLGWRDDADFKAFVKKEAAKSLAKAQVYYRIYVPFRLRVALFNMYTNLERLLGPPVYFLYDLVFGKGASNAFRKGASSRSTKRPSSRTGAAKASSSRARPSSTRRAASS
mmetsp:Transcript_27577/g.84609  ORF Transcript_27577/g.84609 Transcript_27577/m.84609 type:complete len:271 (-) Transcript_27577:1183-1995(-)